MASLWQGSRICLTFSKTWSQWLSFTVWELATSLLPSFKWIMGLCNSHHVETEWNLYRENADCTIANPQEPICRKMWLFSALTEITISSWSITCSIFFTRKSISVIVFLLIGTESGWQGHDLLFIGKLFQNMGLDNQNVSEYSSRRPCMLSFAYYGNKCVSLNAGLFKRVCGKQTIK
jgi:hypothetical protein